MFTIPDFERDLLYQFEFNPASHTTWLDFSKTRSLFLSQQELDFHKRIELNILINFYFFLTIDF